VADLTTEFAQVDDARYRLTIGGVGVSLDIDRLRRERHELFGELTVTCQLRGTRTVDGVLSVGTFNLSSPTARTQRAKLLREQSETELDFLSYLEELCQRTIAAERNGTPARPLQYFERPGPDGEHDVDGWRLLRDHPTIGFGDGGGGKSYLALYGAGTLARHGVNVLLADWELSGGDHHDRIVRLFGEDAPTIHYIRCERPLIDEADRIRREVRRLSIDYWIADSIAPACGGPPEAAEHATEYFRAVRQIGVGSLHLAHVNRSESGDQKPFGSSFWHNLARATFFIKQADVSADGRQVTLGLFQRKANLGPIRPAIGFQFAFDGLRTIVSRTDLAESELAPKLSIAQRMTHLLRQRPRPVAEIAAELEESVDAVKKAVSRNVRMFTRVPNVSGVDAIALVERRAM
jgi:hypothetical protein